MAIARNVKIYDQNIGGDYIEVDICYDWETGTQPSVWAVELVSTVAYGEHFFKHELKPSIQVTMREQATKRIFENIEKHKTEDFIEVMVEC